MRSLHRDNLANVDMVITAVVAAVVFAISIAIVYAILGGIDYTTYDNAINGSGTIGNYTPATNASNNLITNLGTFYQIGPIYLIVIAAVAIISAILVLRARR